MPKHPPANQTALAHHGPEAQGLASGGTIGISEERDARTDAEMTTADPEVGTRITVVTDDQCAIMIEIIVMSDRDNARITGDTPVTTI